MGPSKKQQEIEILQINPAHDLYEQDTITFFSPSSQSTQRYKELAEHPTFKNKKNHNFWLREHYQINGELHSTVMPAVQTGTNETWYYKGEIHCETGPAVLLKKASRHEPPISWVFSDTLLTQEETVFNTSKNNFLNPTKNIEERLAYWYTFRDLYKKSRESEFHATPFRHFAADSYLYGLHQLHKNHKEIYKTINPQTPIRVQKPEHTLEKYWQHTNTLESAYFLAEEVFKIDMSVIPLRIVIEQLTAWFNNKEKDYLEKTYNITL